jgi:hypothetical protein
MTTFTGDGFMKKMLSVSFLVLTMGVCASAYAANTLNETQRNQVYNKIASIEPLNGADVQDTRNFVNTASENEIRHYLIDLSYEHAKTVDNPNAMDLADIKASLEHKTLAQLID